MSCSRWITLNPSTLRSVNKSGTIGKIYSLSQTNNLPYRGRIVSPSGSTQTREWHNDKITGVVYVRECLLTHVLLTHFLHLRLFSTFGLWRVNFRRNKFPGPSTPTVLKGELGVRTMRWQQDHCPCLQKSWIISCYLSEALTQPPSCPSFGDIVLNPLGKTIIRDCLPILFFRHIFSWSYIN